MIPESISSLVYNLKYPIIWTLGIWILSLVGFITMVDYNETYSGVAFASCTFLTFVGAIPLIKHEKNILHYIFGILACVTSQLWVLLVGDWITLLVLWVMYGLWIIITKDKNWCFLAEIWCLINIILTLI